MKVALMFRESGQTAVNPERRYEKYAKIDMIYTGLCLWVAFNWQFSLDDISDHIKCGITNNFVYGSVW